MAAGDTNINVICNSVLVINYMSLSGYFICITVLLLSKEMLVFIHIMCGSQGMCDRMNEHKSCKQWTIAKGPNRIMCNGIG